MNTYFGTRVTKNTFVLLIITACIAGISGYYLGSLAPAVVSGWDDVSDQVRLGSGTLTNPLLECEVSSNTINSPKKNFLPALQTFVAGIEKRKGISNVAIYFRDLNNGPTFGIRSDDPFIPASLLKVPVLMTFVKHAEADPSILSQPVRFEQSRTTTVQEIRPQKELIPGEQYSVVELLEHMIVFSDNQALLLLWSLLPGDEYRQLHEYLGVDPAVLGDPTRSLSVREYSTFFRILFNASFLSQEHSEYVLRLLTKTQFSTGLRAGVPSAIPVAHKFGERRLSAQEDQLHDCGIVYYPNHPYLLCVMTRGENKDILSTAVADVSRFVYEQVDTQYGK